MYIVRWWHEEQEGKYTYDVKLRRVHVTVVAVQKQ
jgi:hypothetical protein